MGNFLRGGGLLGVGSGSKEDSKVRVGRHVTVGLLKNRRTNGKYTAARSIFYQVGDSFCEMELSRQIDIYNKVKGLCLKLQSTGPSKLDTNRSMLFEFILTVESETISVDPVLSPSVVINVGKSTALTPKTRNVLCGDGSVIESYTWLYGEGHKAGLVRLEKKKRSPAYAKHYAVTVIHYHATSAGIHTNQTGEVDFGLSVLANIEARHGYLSIAVEGPEQHPSSALFYMFKEFERHGGWKPTMCPHCASNRNLSGPIGCPSNDARQIKNY